MPTWNEINDEIEALGTADACDQVRMKYLLALQELTNRTVLAYYSGFLQKRQASGLTHPEASITDLDMNGLMAVVHNVDRSRGLDLVIHTPGGGIEATRAIVEYLYSMFPDHNLRVIVPHMAMSAGTMIACAARTIVLGKHSCLGPTDPHIKGAPAMGIMAEVEDAINQIRKDPLKQVVYQQVFAKYPPAFIGDCERAVIISRSMVAEWLRSNMFKEQANAVERANAIVEHLTDYKGVSSHSHHFLLSDCMDMGLNIEMLEADQDLQEAVLSVHHSFVATFTRTDVIKIMQNAGNGIWTVDA